MPVTAIFTSFGPYSVTDSPASAATTMMAPVARATVSALTWFLFQATRSTATDEGRWVEIASRTAAHSCRSRSDSSETGRGGDGARPDQGRLPAVAVDDGEAEPGQARVHAEHASLEHPFARV